MNRESGRTFSESWHRVAELRVALRSTLCLRKQRFQGKDWYVLRDPFNNYFFRLEKPAYDFVFRLSTNRTVAEVWQESLKSNPETAPGQDEVIRLLAQLYHANLLFCELPIDSLKLFERFKKRRQRESRGKFLSLMFFKLPLLDPDPWLDRHAALVQLLTSRGAFGGWLILLLLAGKSLLDRVPLLLSEVDNLFSFKNLILLYAGLVLVKMLHELGHTLVCKRFGGEVHTVGVMFMIFTPLPYMDATSSWAFRARRQRILVASAGMIYEFFAAGCAALLWANTGPGAIHSLALNMLIAASVSTLLFNANPLLRYDGYYILSDLLDIPNLQSRSLEQLKYLARRYLFNIRQANSPADTGREARWFSLYGILSGIYRLLVYGGIVLFVAERFLLVGLLMAVFLLLVWGFLPIGRFIAYLTTSAELGRNRSAVIGRSLIALVVLVTVFGAIPLPNRFRAPGVVESAKHTRVVGQTDGRLHKILQQSGEQVVKGEPLLQLLNPELDIELKLVAAQRTELLYLQQQNAALQGDSIRKTLQSRLDSLERRIDELERRQQALLVTAASAGIWTAPDLEERLGNWLERGEKLGDIVALDRFKFVAVIGQEDAASLFTEQAIGQISVRLTGNEGNELPAADFQIIPFEQLVLPSATLGWKGGGKIPVKGRDELGLETLEPFFRISAELGQADDRLLRHGHSGQIRFSLPAESVLTQVFRKLRQFIQQRYQT